MAEPIVVIGIGGFGREVIDVIDAINDASPDPIWDLLGAVDDSPTELNLERLAQRGVDFMGGTDVPLDRRIPTFYVVGIGSPQVRRHIAERYDAANFRAATLIHPCSTLGSGVTVGAGTVICAGARLTTNIELGQHVHLNPNVTVGHDSTVGSYVSVNPLASISGDCVIQAEALIGVAGVILNGLTVGTRATVGGSSCVVRDVGAGATVKGVPAR